MKRIAICDGTVERLERAAHAAFASGIGSALIAMLLLALGMERAALALAALGLGVGGPLGVVLALLTVAVAALVERRRAKP